MTHLTSLTGAKTTWSGTTTLVRGSEAGVTDQKHLLSCCHSSSVGQDDSGTDFEFWGIWELPTGLPGQANSVLYAAKFSESNEPGHSEQVDYNAAVPIAIDAGRSLDSQ
jgi:hypothetical protein